MQKYFFLLLILTACAKDNSSRDWKLVWSDEFDKPGLPDAANWGNEVGFIRNNELQFYTERRLENSVIGDGKLMIIGRKENWTSGPDTAGYTSASITTDDKHSWTYGKIEASIRLPEGQGLWPAFWMLGQNIHEIGWPRCGEIDIMEHINTEPKTHGTLHWHNEKHVSSGKTTPCDVTEYHLYTVEWEADTVKWFLDGKQFHQVVIKDGVNSTEEFHKPHYIILNLAIGGNWPKSPDETTIFPDTMFVDFVRVYQNYK